MTLTTTDFDNAERDLKTVSAVSNSRDPDTNTPVDEYQTRLGDTSDTLNGRIKKLGYEPPIPYASGISFAANDNVKTVDESGVIYAPKPTAIPFTTSGTWIGDDDQRFFVIQGALNVNVSPEFATEATMISGSSQNLGNVDFANYIDRSVFVNDGDGQEYKIYSSNINGNMISVAGGFFARPLFNTSNGYNNGSQNNLLGDLVNGTAIPVGTDSVSIGGERYGWDTDNPFAPTTLTEAPQEDGSVLTGGEGFGVPNKSRELRYIQLKNLNEAERRLRQHEQLEISWYGDSNSARNSSATIVQFRVAMQKTYPNVVVYDRAQSGMTTYRTFSWESSADNPNVKLSIINLGTNDALWDRHPKDYGVLTDYAFELRALVSRQIMRGHGVVLVSPVPQRIDYEWAKYNEDPVTNPFSPEDIRPDSATLTAIMKQVADEFGCKFVDLRELLQWYGDYQFFNNTSLGLNDLTPYGDPIHLDLDYSHTWGRYVAAAISCGNLNYTYMAHAESEFQFRKGVEPVAVSAEATRGVQAEWRFDTGRDISHATSESNTGGMHRAMFLNVAGDAVTWSFYVPEGGVCVTPVIYLFDPSVVRFYWNTSSQPLRHMVDPSRQLTTGSGWNNTGQSVIDVSSGGASLLNTTYERSLSGITSATVDNTCHLLRSGWHSITLELTSGSALFSGLIFSDSKSKILKEELAQLRDSQSLTAADMDNIINTGFYSGGTDTSNVPPTGGDTLWTFQVYSNDSKTVVTQIGTGNNSGRLSVRQRLSGVWSAWSPQS